MSSSGHPAQTAVASGSSQLSMISEAAVPERFKHQNREQPLHCFICVSRHCAYAGRCYRSSAMRQHFMRSTHSRLGCAMQVEMASNCRSCCWTTSASEGCRILRPSSLWTTPHH